MRMESLAGKVDFNERRVRGIEGAIHQAKPSGRREDARREDGRRDVQEVPPTQVVVPATEVVTSEPAAAGQGPPSDGARRRRRRRRGRRGSGALGEVVPGVPDTRGPEAEEPEEGADEDEGTTLVAETDLPTDHARHGYGDPPKREDGDSHAKAEAGSTVTVEETADHHAGAASYPMTAVEETIVVVAEAERLQDPVPFAVPGHDAPVLREAGSGPEPEAPADDLASPAFPARRDLEPTDK